MMEFVGKKFIYSANVDAQDGSFALESPPLKFETCRERFGRQWDENTRGWFFKHPPNKSEDIASFLLKTEAILKQSTFSKFCNTNRNTILWIEPSEFWKSCRMRRSLLTIFIRAGMVYSLRDDNYEDALFKQEYVVPTKNAVKRFLYGFTKYAGPDLMALNTSSTLESKGWKTVFDGKSSEYIKTTLVWPDETHYKPVYNQEEALWF